MKSFLSCWTANWPSGGSQGRSEAECHLPLTPELESQEQAGHGNLVRRRRMLFSVRCICGEQLRSEGKTGTCPTCKREFRIESPADYQPQELLISGLFANMACLCKIKREWSNAICECYNLRNVLPTLISLDYLAVRPCR